MSLGSRVHQRTNGNYQEKKLNADAALTVRRQREREVRAYLTRLVNYPHGKKKD